MDRGEKVDTFVQFGELSESLQYVKSLILTDLNAPHGILDTISRKASLETLDLRQVEFYVEPLTTPPLSVLRTVTVLILRECRFGRFEDFVSFIRCFPLCEVLRLRGCTWLDHEVTKLKSEGPAANYIAPAHLEITNNFATEWGDEYCDQGGIIRAARLDLTGLKSFTYTFEGEAQTKVMLENIAACDLLEEIDLTIPYSVRRDFGECEHSSYFFNPEFVESIDISDGPVDPIRRSYQIPHHQV